MVGLCHKRHHDAAPMFIMVMQILTGKTVHAGGRCQFGRSLRHKDVDRCPIGAFAFYLLYCFAVTGEIDDGRRPNFCNNKEWFNKKILGTVSNQDVSIQKRTYCDQLSKLFKRLRILSASLGH